MGEPHSVKARAHHGSESLDITIPAELKREHGISQGDVFVVDVDEDGDQLVLTYDRIYDSEE